MKRQGRIGSEVFDKKTTNNPKLAERIYLQYINRNNEFSGSNVAAVLSLNRCQLMYHRYDSSVGDNDNVTNSDVTRMFSRGYNGIINQIKISENRLGYER